MPLMYCRIACEPAAVSLSISRRVDLEIGDSGKVDVNTLKETSSLSFFSFHLLLSGFTILRSFVEQPFGTGDAFLFQDSKPGLKFQIVCLPFSRSKNWD